MGSDWKLLAVEINKPLSHQFATDYIFEYAVDGIK